MYGQIIKFHRLNQNITQNDLCHGICSTTHLSKIERDSTQFSEYIVEEICERLHINLEEERKKFTYLNTLLHDLLDSMVKQQSQKVETLVTLIQQNPYNQSEHYRVFYLLLMLRYQLSKGNVTGVDQSLERLRMDCHAMSPFEQNLLWHVGGIYELLVGDFQKSISWLTKINPVDYPNHEFYFHLAGANHSLNDKIKTYYYALKALNFFKKENNFNRILDTETILIIYKESCNIYTLEEVEKEYNRLVEMSESLGAINKQIVLLNNLAFGYFRREDYNKARSNYNKVISLVEEDKQNYHYYLARFGYYHSQLRQNKLGIKARKEIKCVLQEISNNLEKSKFRLSVYKYYIQLLTYLANEDYERYYRYMHEVLIPHLNNQGDAHSAHFYLQMVLEYENDCQNFDRATQITKELLAVTK
jgi:HTH-type transcriptional regulator, quorum sensing regulator NprR